MDPAAFEHARQSLDGLKEHKEVGTMDCFEMLPRLVILIHSEQWMTKGPVTENTYQALLSIIANIHLVLGQKNIKTSDQTIFVALANNDSGSIAADLRRVEGVSIISDGTLLHDVRLTLQLYGSQPLTKARGNVGFVVTDASCPSRPLCPRTSDHFFHLRWTHATAVLPASFCLDEVRDIHDSQGGEGTSAFKEQTRDGPVNARTPSSAETPQTSAADLHQSGAHDTGYIQAEKDHPPASPVPRVFLDPEALYESHTSSSSEESQTQSSDGVAHEMDPPNSEGEEQIDEPKACQTNESSERSSNKCTTTAQARLKPKGPDPSISETERCESGNERGDHHKKPTPLGESITEKALSALKNLFASLNEQKGLYNGYYSRSEIMTSSIEAGEWLITANFSLIMTEAMQRGYVHRYIDSTDSRPCYTYQWCF